MLIQILIALVAGTASALMFVSIVSGALISLVLFYLAPLPLMVVALGWGTATALVGGIAGSLAMGVALGLPYLAAFAITIAAPAFWLGRLALLAKPLGTPVPGQPPELDWYPPGRILLWIAGFAAATTITALLSLGTDAASISDALRRGLVRVFGGPGASGREEVSQLVSLLVAIAPSAATTVAMLTLTINLWLAGRITRTSGRLTRPWPMLDRTELPPLSLAALGAALLLVLAGGLVAIFAQIVAAALIMAYAISGFAVLHLLTQGHALRAMWLGCTYVAVLVFGWPLIGVAVLGIADALLGFRRRKLNRLGPPLSS